MATYTDLHIKTKETINIDHCSGITNQKVKFVNPENIFRGTFIGGYILSGNNNIDGGIIKNVTIDSSYVKDVFLKNGEELNQELDNIVDKIDDNANNFTNNLNQISSNLSSVIRSTNTKLTSDIQILSNSIDSISTDVHNISAHYNKTFSEKSYSNGPDLSVDVLNIVNSENTTDQYSLQFLSGTLVLVKKQ